RPGHTAFSCEPRSLLFGKSGGAGMAEHGRAPHVRASADQCDDRLAGGYFAAHPLEALRIAERLCVEQDGTARVLFAQALPVFGEPQMHGVAHADHRAQWYAERMA